MCLSVFEFKKYIVERKLVMPVVSGALFLLLSILVYMVNIDNGFISFMLGLIACFSVITSIEVIYENRRQTGVVALLAKYTMPIFLMHTLFAAPLRTLLFKFGVHNAVVHVFMGIAISFVGPMIAAVIMKRSKWLEFFLYPGKFIKIK